MRARGIRQSRRCPSLVQRGETQMGAASQSERQTDDSADAEWAKRYCAWRGLRYLSHERYGRQVMIAVEKPGERYEIKVDHPISAAEQANGAQGRQST